MTNSTPKSYEAAILQQLIRNYEEIAVIKQDINQIKNKVNFAQWLLITIAVGVLINIISPPIVSLLN